MRKERILAVIMSVLLILSMIPVTVFAAETTALEFGEMLKRRTGLEVVMWDERLTTVEADRTLMEAGVRRENRKQYLDGLAAVFILQGYLDSLTK